MKDEQLEHLLVERERLIDLAEYMRHNGAPTSEYDDVIRQITNLQSGLAAQMPELLERAKTAEAIIATHDLCHDLHGKVGPCEFAEGCAREQRKLFGWAYHADAARRLKIHNICLVVLNIISWIIVGAMT
jgi:hypothetical protein